LKLPKSEKRLVLTSSSLGAGCSRISSSSTGASGCLISSGGCGFLK
jgi:hypothetical protein